MIGDSLAERLGNDGSLRARRGTSGQLVLELNMVKRLDDRQALEQN